MDLDYAHTYMRMTFSTIKFGKLNMKKYLLYLLIIIIGFAIYPIIRYYYFNFFDPSRPEYKFYVVVRTFWSMPLLILSGIILIAFYKQKVLGFLSILSGILVGVLILQALSSF